MNTIDNYINFLNDHTAAAGVSDLIQAIEALDHQDPNFVSSVTSLKDNFNDDGSEDAERVIYILERIIEQHPIVYADWEHWRKEEYPNIGDQLDMLWHAMDSGALPKVDSFYNSIKDIKDKYPKS